MSESINYQKQKGKKKPESDLESKIELYKKRNKILKIVSAATLSLSIATLGLTYFHKNRDTNLNSNRPVIEQTLNIYDDILLVDDNKDKDRLIEQIITGSGKVPILMYHELGKPENRYTVSPERFNSHLKKLYDNDFQLISLEDYVNKNFEGLKDNKKPVVITFDDEDEAVKVLDAMQSMWKEPLLKLEQAVVVTKDQVGEVRLRQTRDLAAGGTVAGESVLSLLAGLIFGRSFGIVWGIDVGKAVRDLTGYGFDENFLTAVDKTMGHNSSAIMFLVRRDSTSDPDEVLKVLTLFRGIIHQTTLSPQAEAYLEQVAQPLREKGLDVECVILSGAPGDTIISYAHENEVKLIAIATRGRSGLGRLAFGSVADFVLRESELPILVMKPLHTEQ